MKYKDNRMTDINIAYIGGGSRVELDFMKLGPRIRLSGTIRLYDIDEQAAKVMR